MVWSLGRQIDSDKVAAAFKLDGKKDLLKRSDAGPTSLSPGLRWLFVILMLVFPFLFVLLLNRCSECDPKVENCSSSSARSSGGSFGGFSSGGGHK